MESNNIQTKVNRIGKAGRIVLIILIVLLSIGAFSLLLAGGVCAVVSCFARGAVSAVLSGWQRMSFNLNLTSVFTALMVFFLCMVFRYGAQLQQEADETL